MPELCMKQASPRHGFVFDRVPTIRGSMYGGSIIRHYPENYGPILDCVYEMANDLMGANGLDANAAIQKVLRDEGWRVIPAHQKLIAAKLDAAGGVK